MARGKSGRVVIEIDPKLKRQLYATLEYKQETMKNWFVREAEGLIYETKQPSLFETADEQPNSKNESDK